MPNLQTVKARLPWWFKIAAQIVISTFPDSYKFWHRLGILEHGRMQDPSYAYGVFMKHYGQVQFARRSTGWVGLELGPGDSLFSVLIARSHLATGCYLADRGDFADKDIQKYKNMALFLHHIGLPEPNLDDITSFEDVLKTSHATYETGGLASLRAIPTASVDYIWSHVALQCIRRAEFFAILLELRRILRNDGASSHVVDLTDQLASALNNLRFPESIWESAPLAKCGTYTNRFRYSEMLALFQKAGFNVEVVKTSRWDHLPTPRSKLARQFQAFSDEDLQISGFQVVLTPAVSVASPAVRSE